MKHTITILFILLCTSSAAGDSKENADAQSPKSQLVGKWAGTADEDNRFILTFKSDSTFELDNVDPTMPQRIKVRATGTYKPDFSVDPAHLDLDALIHKKKLKDPLKHKFELIIELLDGNKLRMSRLESASRPKMFGKKAVMLERQELIVENETSSSVRLLHELDVRPIAFAFSGDSQLLAVTDGKSVSIWNAANGRKVHEFNDHTIPVTAIALSPRGKLLATVGCTTTRPGDLEMKLWDLRSGKVIQSVYEKEHRGSGDAAKPNPFVTFSPDGKLIAFPAKDRYVTVRNVEDWSEQQKWEIGNIPAAGAFSFDNKLIAVGTATGSHGSVALYDLANGKRIRFVSNVYESVRQVSFSADGRSIYAVYGTYLFRQDTDAPDSAHPEEDTIWAWHRSELPRMTRPYASSYSVTNHLLAQRCFKAESVTLYDTTTKKNYGTIASSKGPDLFSPNGKLLVTGDKSGKTVLWAIATPLSPSGH